MVKVATLKEQARQFERDGDLEKALAIYRHILTHLEGTPAIKGQLPLYVKVGDLHLKQGDTEGAIDMYERAADHYAEHGSAKSVIALCLKILRVAPKHTSVYLTYARQLLENGHVAATRDVLADFAERANLVKPLETLRKVADSPDAEVRPVLERMLAGVKGRPAEPAPPLEEEEPVHEPVPEPQQTVAAHEEAEEEPPEEESAEHVATVSTADVAQEMFSSEQPEPYHEMERSRVSGEMAAEISVVQRRVDRASERGTASERRPFESFARDAERRKTSSRIWLFAALALIVLAIIGAFIKLGVIPLDLGGLFGGSEATAGNASAAGPTSGVPAAVADSAGEDLSEMISDTVGQSPDSIGVDSLAVDSLVTDSSLGNASGASGGGGAAAAAAQPAGLDQPTAPQSAASSGSASRPSGTAPLPAGLELSGPIILIGGLAVDSVTEFPSGELTGVRVIHRLATNEPLILRAVPAGGRLGDTTATGPPRVTPLRGDTAFGSVMFAGYRVNARGKLPTDTLRALLQQLVRVQPQN